MPVTLSPRLRVDFPAVQTRLNAEEEAVVMETDSQQPYLEPGRAAAGLRAGIHPVRRMCRQSGREQLHLGPGDGRGPLRPDPGGRGHSPGPHLCVQRRSLCPHRSPAGVRRYRSGHPAAVGPVRQALPDRADQDDRGGSPLRFARRHGPDSPPGPGAWTQGGGRRGPGPGRGLQGAQDRIHGGLCRLQLPQPEEYLHSGRGRHADHQGRGGRGAGQKAPLDGQLALCRRAGALLAAGHGEPGERHEGSLALQLLPQRGAVCGGDGGCSGVWMPSMPAGGPRPT